MNRVLLLTYSLLVIIGASVQAQQVSNAKFNKMLSKLLDHSVTEIGPNNQIDQNTIFLDAREVEEFDVSHLPNALHVGYNNFDVKKLQHLNKKKPIIVYCTVGYRSEKIAEQLQKNGFQNVKNLYGGIFEWVHQNKPIINNNKPTDSIHTYNKDWSQWLQKGTKVY